MPRSDPDARRAYHREYMRERYRHDAEHRQRQKSHNRRWKRAHRERVRAYIAGVKAEGCRECGEKDRSQLHFHHLRDKEFNVADWVKLGKSEAQVRQEIEKCIVLCATCHYAEHLPPLRHGTRAGYGRGCRCDACRSAQSIYARTYYARTKAAL